MRQVTFNIVISFLLLAIYSGCAGPGSTRDKAPWGSGRSGSSEGDRPRLTVVLAQYGGENRIAAARDLQPRARNVLDTEDVWFQNADDYLQVNYGHFRTNKEAEAALEKVKKLYDKINPGRLQFAFVKEIPAPDPPAPAEWDLHDSPCEYTLQIGIYYDEPEKDYYNRKADAVEAVRRLRESGQKAYFYHDKFHSRVCVGCFPASHVNYTVINGKQDISLSPQIKLLQKQHPYHYDQGFKIYEIMYDKKGKKYRIPHQSVLIRVADLERDTDFGQF